MDEVKVKTMRRESPMRILNGKQIFQEISKYLKILTNEAYEITKKNFRVQLSNRLCFEFVL